MFGRNRSAGRGVSGAAGASRSSVSRRHERRPIRSSITGPSLPNPNSRFARFETDARGAVQVLQAHFPQELDGVRVGFQTAPTHTGESKFPLLYTIDRSSNTIMLFRMPIQRARGLHVNDDEHRRYFVQHCVYQAVCEYLGREPWELLPGRFDHY
ncbi:metallopeptidase family protein [Leucobacter salsicius]|uniref:metallopeptidase family protein n=1 Tax=Leucobacter salsicius TaxID=664638 RepID=UPI00037D8E9D|nr:metallopeptidase family protein [Leucobacter salsicius]